MDGHLRAAWVKLKSYAARLALIFHLCNVSSGQAVPGLIDELSMRTAISMADWFGKEARRVYQLFSKNPDERAEQQLIELIWLRGGRITPRDLHRAKSGLYPSSEEAEAALDALMRKGFGTWEVVPSATNQRTEFVLTLSDETDSHDSPERGESVSDEAEGGQTSEEEGEGSGPEPPAF